MYSDLQTIAPEQYMKTITKRLTDLHAVSVSWRWQWSYIFSWTILFDTPIHLNNQIELKSTIIESRRSRCHGSSVGVSLSFCIGSDCWCNRSYGSISNWLSQNSYAESKNWILHWRTYVQKQFRLLQEGDSSWGPDWSL